MNIKIEDNVIVEIENKIEHLYDGVEKCFDIIERLEMDIIELKRSLENEKRTS